MTVAEFAKLTDISYRSAMNYLNKNREPSVELLIKIHQHLNVNIMWLLTGKGSMFFNPLDQNSLSDVELNLLESYRKMPDKLKKAFIISFKEISKDNE